MLPRFIRAHKGLSPSGKITPTALTIYLKIIVYLQFFNCFAAGAPAHAGRTTRLWDIGWLTCIPAVLLPQTAKCP